ncbi:MAG: 30S ribosomal protein S16 [Chloroflexi bacterium RBG_13_68_17]|jgi:small subunit ribosomal protein S16|nr:MAG: 30S ribosomal protein S16 [Chloroflexi bacterium RBG_13_68_17]
MVRIRLRRVGAKRQPSYRIVVADRESPRDGRFLEVIGNYNPRTKPSTVDLDEARLYHWLGKGAQPSESVDKILRGSGALARWERVKQGESADVVLKEASEAVSTVDRRTRRDDLAGARPSKKAKKVEEDGPAAEAA